MLPRKVKSEPVMTGGQVPASETPESDGGSRLVSVIVPHLDDYENLDACLRLLQDQSFPNDRTEIVVADNGSSRGIDAVRQIVGGRGRVIEVAERGAGPARNAGVAASHGTVLAFIDSDCRPAADWIERGLAAMSRANVIGGSVEVDVLDPANPTGAEAFEKVFAFNFKHYIEEKGFSGSGNLFVRRKDFDRVGGFRSVVAEDVDWTRRATAVGLRLAYANDVVVSHPARYDWDQLKNKWRKSTAEAYAVACEKRYGRLLWFFRSWAILASPFAHSVTVLRSKKLMGMDQKAKAVAVLFRLRAWRFVETNRLLFSK
jgi:glycosyltransferase involved in cell wall biosynthesis